MNRIALVTVIISCTAIICTSCDKDKETKIVGIEDISFENYPRVNCSTSTVPLNHIVAAKLLDLEYEWTLGSVSIKNYLELPESFLNKIFRSSQTHGAIIDLIDNQSDLIFVARKMSADEKQYADNAGVSLIETPIALDALDFIINVQNSVNSLSVEQVQKIYLGNITNWTEVGGANEEIIPFIRNPNAVNKIAPNKNSIKNKTYPFVANVYVSIRSNTDPNSMTYKLYEWLQSKSGKDVIEESGYVPN